jgi:cytochrome c peroxidase
MKNILSLTLLVAFSLIVAQKNFAQEEKKNNGLKLFTESKCTSCHSLESAGIKKKPNQKPPDLSNAASLGTPEFIGKYLQKTETKNGRKHLMLFKGSDEELKTLTEWLVTIKADSTK